VRESSQDSASLEIFDYITKRKQVGQMKTCRYPESSQTVFNQTVLFTKGDRIGLERFLVPPRQRVLEFGREVQDIEGTF